MYLHVDVDWVITEIFLGRFAAVNTEKKYNQAVKPPI